MDARAITELMLGRAVSIQDLLDGRMGKKVKPSEVRNLKRELDHLRYSISEIAKLAGHDQEPQAFVSRLKGVTWEDQPLDIGMGVIFRLDDHRVFEVNFTDDSRLEVRALSGRLQVQPRSSNVIYVDVGRH